MPDRAMVIAALRSCTNLPQCRGCPWEDCQNITYEVCDDIPMSLVKAALELLEEQEPITIKRPERLDEIYDFMAYCPECHMQWVMYDSEKMRYCPGCGRRVKWDG